MHIKKSGGTIFGAVLTKAEQKALELEINRQLIEKDKVYQDDIDILVLYVLHTHLGFGKKRLERFYKAFNAEHQKLIDHYEMPEDNVWLAEQELKRIGVDVVEWNKHEN